MGRALENSGAGLWGAGMVCEKGFREDYKRKQKSLAEGEGDDTDAGGLIEGGRGGEKKVVVGRG